MVFQSKSIFIYPKINEHNSNHKWKYPWKFQYSNKHWYWELYIKCKCVYMLYMSNPNQTGKASIINII